MKTRIHGGRLIDPARNLDANDELWIEGQTIIDGGSLTSDDADVQIDASGCVVMAGGVDIHTHIGGGKLSLARILLSDVIDRDAEKTRRTAEESDFLPAAAITSQRYLQMGYTVAFEPAMIPCNARAAHSEMSDMPGLATGGFCLLGNDDLLLSLIAKKTPQPIINDYVAWMVHATQAIAVKVVNAGGISAFKFAQRNLDVDTPHPHYGVTPSQVISTLARAVYEIGLVHPLHVHCSNLGVPGNIASTLATIKAADGFPIHLTHAQFHCYGKGDLGMTSAADQLVEAMDQHPNVTIDVGQIMFGQTVTISADAPHQFDNRKYASPRKSVLVDIECEAGCGVIPFRYRRKQFVHSLQWAIGLELFLKVNDPSRVFLTTDHPNGAPFTAYPHLLRLLGDRTFRETALAEIHPDAAAASSLGGIDREYSLGEIATMTRSAPASIMGLAGRGDLSQGSVADVVIYREDLSDLERMFDRPEYVFASGTAVLSRDRDGLSALDLDAAGKMDSPTLTADVQFDAASIENLRLQYNQRSTFDFRRLRIGADEMEGVLGTKPIKQRRSTP